MSESDNDYETISIYILLEIDIKWTEVKFIEGGFSGRIKGVVLSACAEG